MMLKDQHTEMSDESSPEESWKFYVLNGLEPWTSGIVVLIFLKFSLEFQTVSKWL